MINSHWYSSIPTFNNQVPKSLESFSPNDKYFDISFSLNRESLIDNDTYKEIMKNYGDDPHNEKYAREKEKADLLNSVKNWKRISDLFPNYDLFPTSLHCDTFKQGKIGDCYFVDMISLLSNYGELITRLFPIQKNIHGYYEVLLFINGWKRVIVDDYIPVIEKNNGYELLSCSSKKYENCFYHILLEKAWAKVNKNYYNIWGGLSSNALSVLTGYQCEFKLVPKDLDDDGKNLFLAELRKGIRTDGYLFGVNTKNHAYSLLNIENYIINNINYQVLKIRNPWGSIGHNIFGENQNLIAKFNNKKAIVEDELAPEFENFNNSEDEGIFYISKNYFFQLFIDIDKCYYMPNSSIIEYLLEFNLNNINRRHFMFKMIVEENSMVQINLTRHNFNNKGKMKFNYYYPDIRMKPFVSNDKVKLIPIGTYFIEWNYPENVINTNEQIIPPNEILFWICFCGNVKLEYMGMSDNSQINNNYNYIFKEENGLKRTFQTYKISEKLGEYFKHKAQIHDFIENTLHLNIKEDEEGNGYSLNYKEDENVAFSFVMNRQDTSKTRMLSQNLYFPEYIFEGNRANSNRIISQGFIYNNNNIVYTGQINYNLFPQNINENNNNRLIIDVEAKRFQLSEEIGENELVNLNQRREGPFSGQIQKPSHSHYLTECITPYRQSWRCDHCDRPFKKTDNSFYCSLCDFDFCNNNCTKPNNSSKEGKLRRPKYNPRIHFNTSQHQHYLICMKLINRNNHLKCFSCLKNIPAQDKLFYCTKCDFRLCQRCKIIEENGEKWQFHTCWHEHPLTFCKTRGYKREKQKRNEYKVLILNNYDFFFVCNHCGVEYSRKKDSFYCTVCDFYICMKCYKDYFFYKGREIENAINNNMENREIYPVHCRCFLGDKNTEDVECQKCNRNLKLSNWTYYCSNCNSNFCFDCRKSHKVIFQNNKIIFDGNFQNNAKNGIGITYKINNEIKYKGEWENGRCKSLNNIPHDSEFIRMFLNENISCNICKKIQDSTDEGIYCRECSLLICDKCIVELNQMLNRSQILHNHNLSIKMYKEDNRPKCSICIHDNKTLIYFICNICNNNSNTTKFYCCFDCFNLRLSSSFRSTFQPSCSIY